MHVAPVESSGQADHLGPSIDELRAENYSFRKVEILAGNIGHLKFDGFVDADEAKATGAAAMAFLRHCDALIVWVRPSGKPYAHGNRGGAGMARTRNWTPEVETLIGHVEGHYFVPAIGRRIGDLLRSRLKAGGYAGQRDEAALARVVTTDMQAVNRDRHLFLEFSAQEVPVRADGLVDSASLRAEQAVLTGHGFARIERLAGNVGLIDIRKFYDPGVAGAGAAAVAAMSLVASADALIIDLRRNLGGEPEMVALVSSFLFDSRTHLVDLEFPGERRTVQYWTDAFVPEPTFGGTKPVIVLTSERTVSGGEGMSYQLQQSRRATVVGDRTAGAANFHYPRRVGPHLISGVPSGYPVDPHSGGNWEGVGVQPDVPIPAEQALAAAYERALEGVLDLGADGARAAINADAHQALIEQRSAQFAPRPGLGDSLLSSRRDRVMVVAGASQVR